MTPEQTMLNGIPPSKIFAVLGLRLLPSQRLIILTLNAAQRPMSEREIMEVLGHPWPTHRGTIRRQTEYLIRNGTIILDKSQSPHRYSLAGTG